MARSCDRQAGHSLRSASCTKEIPNQTRQYSPMRYPIEPVIFDMDGLMIDTEPIYKRALQETAVEFGYHLSDEFAFTLIGLPNPACRLAIAGHLGPDFPL